MNASILSTFDAWLEARPAWGAHPDERVEACVVPGQGALASGLCLGSYEGAWRQLIVQAKQSRQAPAVVALQRALIRAVSEAQLPPGLLLTPPPSRRRRWQGWSLPCYLAQALARERGWPRARALCRLVQRPPQHTLGGDVRRQHLLGTMARRLGGQAHWQSQAQRCGRVYLLDDVWTTGATLRECVRALACPVPVHPLVLAQVPDLLGASA